MVQELEVGVVGVLGYINRVVDELQRLVGVGHEPEDHHTEEQGFLPELGEILVADVLVGLSHELIRVPRRSSATDI